VNLKEKYRLEDEGVIVRMTLSYSLKKRDGATWPGFIWLKMGKTVGLFQTR